MPGPEIYKVYRALFLRFRDTYGLESGEQSAGSEKYVSGRLSDNGVLRLIQHVDYAVDPVLHDELLHQVVLSA